MRDSAAVPASLLAALVLLAGALGSADAELVPCRRPSDTRRIEAALERIRRTVDPCGESGDIQAVLDTLARCTAVRHEICTSDVERNLFDRPALREATRTILWNPDLESELLPRCAGETEPVRREPTASLLHELVHAAHDCAGLDPGTLELEAVRIENIYRRAAGLPQRRGYGVEPLPAAMTRACDATSCTCARPDGGDVARRAPEAADGPVAATAQITGDAAAAARP